MRTCRPAYAARSPARIRRSASIVSRARGATASQGRSCQPLTISGLDAPSARSARAPVREMTEARPSASATGLRTPTASGPIFSASPGTRSPTAVASANASKLAISPSHIAPKPLRPASTAISSASSSGRSSQNGATTSRSLALDAAGEAHSCAVFVGRPSSSRPAELPCRRVDLEVSRCRVSVAEPPLQWRVLIDRRATAQVVHRARHVRGRPDRVGRRESQPEAQRVRDRLVAPGRRPRPRRWPRSTGLAQPAARPRPLPPPPVSQDAPPGRGSSPARSSPRPAR